MNRVDRETQAKAKRSGRLRPIALLILVVSLVAAACDSAVEETTTTTTTTLAPTTTTTTTTTTVPENLVPEGGTAVIGLIQANEPVTLNSFMPGGDTLGAAIIGQATRVGVYEISGHTRELVPEVVIELPTIANGGLVLDEDGTMTVRYEIREEAVWADGTPITGADFQFTLDTILNPDFTIDKRVYEDITESAFTEKTFTYKLVTPTLAHELLFPTLLPRHDVEGSDFELDWNKAPWVSGGPYVFEEWEVGESMRFVRNDNYWKTNQETGQQLPYLDEIIFRFVTDEEELLNAFSTGEVDVIQPTWSLETVGALQTLEPAGAAIDVVNGNVWEHLNFQFGPGRLERNQISLNENLTYRKAIAHAIARQALVDQLLGGGVAPLDSYVQAFIPSVSGANWSQYSHDPAQAAALIEDAKVEAEADDVRVVFSTTSNSDLRVQLADLLAGMFAEAGIEYESELEDPMLFFGDTISVGVWDLGEWAWLSSPGLSGLVGIHDVWDPAGKPPNGTNYIRWGTDDSSVQDATTARFAEVLEQMNTTVDGDQLVPLIQEAESILADNVVILPLYARPMVAVSWTDQILGVKHNATAAMFTWNVEEWHQPDEDSAS